MNTRSFAKGLVLTLVLLGVWTPASADLDDALDEMLVVTGTEGGVYESQRRGGITVGDFRMRAPISSINLVNLTAPQLRGGCGGIDAYGGSFTYLNTDAFRQILRQIGANAIGYAFKLALATMCEKCDSILTGLQDAMNQFTRMSVDSCRWAQGMVNDTVKAVGLAGQVKGDLTASAVGDAEDMFDAALEAFGEPGKWFANGEADGADTDDPEKGNQTWNALKRADVAGLYGFAAGTLSHNEVLLNIAGSVMVRAANDAEKAAGRRGEVVTTLRAPLSFTELKRGKIPSVALGRDANPLWDCDTDEKCLQPTPIAEWDFAGTDAWVKARLTTIAEHMRDPATAADPHDAEDIRFLGSVPFNVVRHLVELQGSPGLDIYVTAASEAIGAHYAVALGQTLVNSIEASFGRTDTLEMPAPVREHLKTFKADVEAEKTRVAVEYMEKVLELEALVDKLQVPNRQKPATLSTQAAK